MSMYIIMWLGVGGDQDGQITESWDGPFTLTGVRVSPGQKVWKIKVEDGGSEGSFPVGIQKMPFDSLYVPESPESRSSPATAALHHPFPAPRGPFSLFVPQGHESYSPWGSGGFPHGSHTALPLQCLWDKCVRGQPGKVLFFAFISF